MTHSKGISWIDDCRIPFVNDTDKGSAKPQGKTLRHTGWSQNRWLEETIDPHTQGRFPANILVCDDMLNDGVINGGGSYSGIIIRKRKGYKLNPNSDNLHSTSPDNYGDKGSNSRYYDIDKWFDNLIK